MKTVKFKDLVVYEDEDYILINKPPFVSSLDERFGEATTIIGLAKEYCEEAQLCHRLDKETSGILAIAKNQEAYRALSMQFEHREVEKIYHALAEGVHNFENEVVFLPIYITSHGTAKIDPRGKPAETQFNTIKAYKNYTLLKCEPVTGRLHQIRVHLWALDAPIAGDTTYGGKPLFLSSIKKKYNLKNETEELPLIQRVALHAFSLKFKPLSGKEVLVEAPYPKDFGVMLKQLEKYS
ncbi:MAG: RluA family pseudouridine synthase [Cytophagaceae bacterium]|nr:RluA family pseudouridine synthase [Cytophagaceae bacterium]